MMILGARCNGLGALIIVLGRSRVGRDAIDRTIIQYQLETYIVLLCLYLLGKYKMAQVHGLDMYLPDESRVARHPGGPQRPYLELHVVRRRLPHSNDAGFVVREREAVEGGEPEMSERSYTKHAQRM